MTQTSPDAPGLRPEARLLLCCARTSLSPARAEQVRGLARAGLDWPRLLRLADAHGAAPLLYWHLNRVVPDAVPAPTRDAFRQWFYDNARHNLLLTGELLRLFSLFAACAYGNLALRQFVDLDLLVAPADLTRARGLLAAEGYRSGLPLAPAQEAAYLDSIGQMPFVREDRACMVELHARIAPRDFHFPLGWERLGPRLRPVSLNGGEVLAPAGEDLLLVLCAHGAKHLWSYLGWVCDVAELLRVRPGVDWPAVAAEARFARCERILWLGLLLAHDLLQGPVPEGLLLRARSVAAVRGLAAEVARRLFREADSRLEGLHNAFFQFRASERPRDGLRYALSLALTPTVADWTGFPLPARLSFLYPLIRPARLAGKYGRRLLRHDRPRQTAEGNV